MQEATSRAQRFNTEDGPEYCGPFRSHFQEKSDYIVLFLFCSKVVIQTEAGLPCSCRVLKVKVIFLLTVCLCVNVCVCVRQREFKVLDIISITVCDTSSIAVLVATVCINPSDDQSVLALQ